MIMCLASPLKVLKFSYHDLLSPDVGGFYLLITPFGEKLCSNECSDRSRGGCGRIS